MAENGVLGTDPLFKGLTRPTMLLGVSFPFATLNLMFVGVSYILTKHLFLLLVVLPVLHGIAYFICFNEPLFLELFMVRNQKCTKVPNYYYYSSNSYSVE